ANEGTESDEQIELARQAPDIEECCYRWRQADEQRARSQARQPGGRPRGERASVERWRHAWRGAASPTPKRDIRRDGTHLIPAKILHTGPSHYPMNNTPFGRQF